MLTGFSNGTGPIFLDQLDCRGTENTLLECNAFTSRGVSICDHSQDVGIRCRGRSMVVGLKFSILYISPHYVYCIYFRLVSIFVEFSTNWQILMSVLPTMENVNTCAIIPLAASTAVVTLATSLTRTD